MQTTSLCLLCIAHKMMPLVFLCCVFYFIKLTKPLGFNLGGIVAKKKIPIKTKTSKKKIFLIVSFDESSKRPRGKAFHMRRNVYLCVFLIDFYCIYLFWSDRSVVAFRGCQWGGGSARGWWLCNWHPAMSTWICTCVVNASDLVRGENTVQMFPNLIFCLFYNKKCL